MAERPRAAAWWLLAFFAVVIAIAVGGVLWLWLRLEGVQMSLHGYAALGLGVVATIALWVGLMSLIYHSHKSGRDDEAGH